MWILHEFSRCWSYVMRHILFNISSFAALLVSSINLCAASLECAYVLIDTSGSGATTMKHEKNNNLSSSTDFWMILIYELRHFWNLSAFEKYSTNLYLDTSYSPNLLSTKENSLGAWNLSIYYNLLICTNKIFNF